MGNRRTLEDIDCIVIHCADVPNGRGDTIEDIDRWHGDRGFVRDMSIAPDFQSELKHVGYHYVIEVTGKVREGRPLTETGAHVQGHNYNTVGICMVGRDQFTENQWAALRELLGTVRSQLPNHPISIKGHREFNSGKNCPGFDVQAFIRNNEYPEKQHILGTA